MMHRWNRGSWWRRRRGRARRRSPGCRPSSSRARSHRCSTSVVAGLHHPVHARKSGQLRLQQVLVDFVELETLAPAEKRAVLKHVDGVWMEGPVGTFAGSVGTSRHLQETVVERQIVTQRVLPSLRVLPVVREALHDVTIDVGEREHPLRRRQDGHRRQGDVRIRWLLVAVRFAARARHFLVGRIRFTRRGRHF